MWRSDGVDDDSQYRKGLGLLFAIGLVALIAGAAFAGLIDEWPGWVFGGLLLLSSILYGGMWLWGTIVLGLLEVFAETHIGLRVSQLAYFHLVVS